MGLNHTPREAQAKTQLHRKVLLQPMGLLSVVAAARKCLWLWELRSGASVPGLPIGWSGAARGLQDSGYRGGGGCVGAGFRCQTAPASAGLP